MRRLFVLALLLMFFGCESGSPTSPESLKPGEYLGTIAVTFNVGSDSAFVVQNGVTFTFADSGWYTCRGQNILNPPTGGGSYRIDRDSLYLTDQVAHLAFFDWTLILNGAFYFQSRPDSLILTQNDVEHRRYRCISLALNVNQELP
jgi:hypothetical protein